jgi:hypothetical protein
MADNLVAGSFCFLRDPDGFRFRPEVALAPRFFGALVPILKLDFLVGR